MNRIFRLVFNRTTGLMQVASELASTHSSPAQSTAAVHRRAPLCAAMTVALGLSTAALPSAFAQAYDYTADETITTPTFHIDGFTVGPNGPTPVTVTVTGNGTLLSNSGGVSVATNVGSEGTLTINGPQTLLQVAGNDATLVGARGKGTLNVQAGGHAALGGLLALGVDANSTGTTLVDGAGSVLSASVIQVGRNGTGTLNISNNAKVQTTGTGNGYGMSVGVASSNNDRGTGIVNVGSGGELEISDVLRLGDAATGTLNVDNNGKVNVSGDLLMGYQSGGLGRLNVSAGGTVTLVAGKALHLGVAQGAVGEVTISGIGAVVNAPSVVVGGNGTGLLNVQNGGVLNASTGLSAEVSGNDPQRISLIRVGGANARINAGAVDVTAVEIAGGGSIVSNTALIRDSFGTVAPTTIMDVGSHWTNSGLMTINGSVGVYAGGRLTSGSLQVSGGINSATMSPNIVTESVLVSGAGSLITATNGITVGAGTNEPFGLLIASDEGRIDAGTGLTLSRNGFVVLGGDAANWTTATAAFNWNAAETAGSLSGAPIDMQATSGGLVFNHTGDISLANTVRSVPSGTTWTGGALINVAGNTTLSGDLTAFGGKVDVRAGTLVLNSNLYTGQGYTDPALALPQQIDVSGGILVLNGSAGFQQTLNVGGTTSVVRSSNVSVHDGGVLAGNATVGDTYVTNGGILSPGRGNVGTITVDGNLFFNAGASGAVSSAAFYDVDLLGNGQGDLLKVTGQAFVGRGSNLANNGDAVMRVNGLDPATSYQNGRTYTVLDAAGGMQGGFDGVSSRSAFITPTLSQNGNQVVLTIAVNNGGTPPVDPGNPGTPGTPGNPGTPGTPGTPVPPPPEVFNPVAQTPNQQGIANGLNSLQQSGQALALYNALLMLDEDGARSAFDELSGEIHASNRAMLLDDRFLRDGISQRMRPDPSMAVEGASLWLAGGGTSKRQDSDNSAARVRQNRAGVMAGIDLSIGGSWTLGAALGSERLRNKVDDRHADSDVDALHAGLYTGFRGESFWLNGGASYADYRVDTQRRIGAGQAWAQTLDGRQDASAVTGFAEGGWDIELDALTLTPYVAVAYTRLTSDAFAETGGSAALAVDASEDDVWATTAGLRAAWDISADQEGGTRIEAGLAWQHAGGDLRADTRNRFVAGSDRFTVSGLPLAGDVAIAELGFSFKPTDNSRLSFFAQGRSGDGNSEFGGQLNWNILF